MPRRSVLVRAPSQVNRLRLAETWPKPVKWCSTTKVLWKPSASASTLFSIHSRKPWLLSVISAPGAGRRACALPKSPKRIVARSFVPPRHIKGSAGILKIPLTYRCHAIAVSRKARSGKPSRRNSRRAEQRSVWDRAATCPPPSQFGSNVLHSPVERSG